MSDDIEMNQIMEGSEPIGTEIFEANLPSNIDFDSQEENKLAMNPQHHNHHINSIKLSNITSDIKSYKIKGNLTIDVHPQFIKGSIIHLQLPTFQARAFDHQKSAGIKSLWESMVGYCKRQLYLNDGYIYVLQRKKQSLQVVTLFKFTNIFKFFIDVEEEKIRFVIKEDEKLINRDYQIQKLYEYFLTRLGDEIRKVGLELFE